MLSILEKQMNRAFEKDVWCLLGLPFDVLSLQDACDEVMEAVEKKKQMVLSVTNINWIVLASADHSFWSNIARSDLNLIDGTPLFWCARFLGLPIPERVAGPTLMEQLSRIKREPKLKVYFLGGAERVAQRASQKLEATELTSVGFCYPGFGSLEEMSRDEYIQKINQSHPDMLVLSIGAKKGMAWITKNKKKLKVAVFSYLGQVINLIGGSIKRAPEWLQKSGCEWLWRIFQEPLLWKRYFFDGGAFLRIFISRVLPLKIFMLLNKKQEECMQPPVLEMKEEGGGAEVFVSGVCNRHSRENIRGTFLNRTLKGKDIVVDLSGTDYVESSFLGNLLLLWKRQQEDERALYVRAVSDPVRRIFYLHGMERFLNASRTRGVPC